MNAGIVDVKRELQPKSSILCVESGVKDIMKESPVLLDYIWELISEVIAVVALRHSFTTPPQKTNKQKQHADMLAECA